MSESENSDDSGDESDELFENSGIQEESSKPSKQVYRISLYESASLSVSEWASLFECLFPNSSETVKPSDLKFLGMIPLGMQNVLGYKTSGFVEPLAWK